MIKYKFDLNEFGRPNFGVEEKYFQLWELASCDFSYLIQIVDRLGELLKNQIPHYDFGFEVYNFDCNKDECKVLNTFEGWRVECVLSTEEIYQLLRDWRDYLIDFEKTKSQS
ncbi:MAG TPA: hypothetical protein VIM65_06160 [Cyclobacteriaceae bacterium]